MIKVTSLLALTALGACGLAAGCTITTTNVNGNDGGDDGATGNDATTESSTGDDGAAPEGAAEASAEAAADAAVEAEAEAAPPPQTSIRVANWAPDAPAGGYDFCVAPHGTTSWSGPVLGGEAAGDGGLADATADGGDAGVPGIVFPQVSAYFELPPGQYDVQIVAAGSTSCATGVIAATTTIPALAQDAFATLALVGDTSPAGSDPTMRLVALTDDSAAPTGTLVRFINAAPSLPAVDFGEGTLAATSFVPLFTNVQLGHAGASGGDAGTVDTNGYMGLGALSAQVFSVHTSTGGTSDTATASSVNLAAGGIATVALVNGKTGGAASQLLLCKDNEAMSGLTTDCNIVSP
jgi:hypothetical protein